jgi:hypothetical protein
LSAVLSQQIAGRDVRKGELVAKSGCLRPFADARRSHELVGEFGRHGCTSVVTSPA